MLILILICWLMTVTYLVLMLIYAKGWAQQPGFEIPAGFVPATKISIVIPARDEEKNIAICLRSILANNYPRQLLEIIVIDDHSTDRTVEIVNGFAKDNVICLRLADHLKPGEQLIAYKKKALEIAIAQSRGDLIITTDADCIAPAAWLRSMAAICEADDPVLIVAPVDFTSDGSMVQVFQSIDFMTMQGITMASHRLKLGNMSNGANFAFTREAFNAVNGYAGIDHLASGDDYLMMMKIDQAYPGRIACLKSEQAIVKTAPQPDWASFFNQRVRWASKSGKYDDKKLTTILILVYLFNFMLLPLFITGFFIPFFWTLTLGMIMIKTASELFFLVPVAAFFKKQRQLFWFPFLQPLHILYIISAGFLGFIGVYKWKGRKVK